MRAPLLLSLLLVLSSACSDDTGILVRTSSSMDFDQSIDSIRFYAGADTIDEPLYFADSNAAEDIQLNGRDIAEDPYKLLLHPKSADMGGIVIAAIAFDDAKNVIGFGQLADLVEFVDGSVTVWDLEISPAGNDILVTETGCLQWQLDSGDYVHIGTADDQDCDGSLVDDDCNDLNPFQSPTSAEDCFNNIDDNCNGFVDAEDTVDSDGDSFPACGPDGSIDCNDSAAAINPDAEEVCDGKDNNCDHFCDDGHDVDKDGISICGSIIDGNDNATNCVGMGDIDCNDNNDRRFPGNPEVCDGVDNDCQNGCDDDDSLDPDSDGYTDCGSIIGQCGTDPAWNDCGPDDPFMHPGKHELCDGKDNNCDGTIDDDRVQCFGEGGGAGDCHQGSRGCLDGAPVGVCETDNGGTVLDGGWCDSYDNCQSYVDPFFCSIQESQTVGSPEVCTVRMSSPTTMCNGRNLKLNLSNGSAPDTCSYTIVGGGYQQGYKLQIADPILPGDPSTQTIHSCAVNMSVGLPQQQWPGVASFSILFIDEDQSEQELRIELRAELVESCDGQPGVVCQTLTNGVFPIPAPAPEPPQM
jgi:hypothetical protein